MTEYEIKENQKRKVNQKNFCKKPFILSENIKS